MCVMPSPDSCCDDCTTDSLIVYFQSASGWQSTDQAKRPEVKTTIGLVLFCYFVYSLKSLKLFDVILVLTDYCTCDCIRAALQVSSGQFL